MSNIDWTLIIGYPVAEAIEYLKEEQQPYRIVVTRSIGEHEVAVDYDIENEDLRIIGVRPASDCLELICAMSNWSVR